MNTVSGSMIDEDVLDWLYSFTAHRQRDICEAINQIADAHRAELSIPHMETDEDVAALSHADLCKILTLAAPNMKHDSTLSNVHLLGLTLAAKGVIEYHLPKLNSPIIVRRQFADRHRKNVIGGYSTREQLMKALNEWLCGMRDIEMFDANASEPPETAGMYLVRDDHEQIRYGQLFPNSDEGWTFSELYSDGTTTCWYSGTNLETDQLPISLLTGWTLVVEMASPNKIQSEKPVESLVTPTHRVYMFLRSLSPHVKSELVAHFVDVFANPLPTVDAIGRLTQEDWQAAAVWCADDSEMDEGKEAWSEHDAWSCFKAVLNAMGFNFETRQFDPQYDYQANEDSLDADDE